MIGGASVTLIDTAGLRATDDIVESEGVRRSIRLIEKSGIVIIVLDGSEPNHPDDNRLFELAANNSPIVVISKCDLPLLIDPGVIHSRMPDLPMFAISAVSGEGFPDLIATITSRCRAISHAPGPSAGAPNIRHREALERAAGHLDIAADHSRSGDGFLDQLALELLASLSSLGEITGQTATEEILERIFSRFCVGK